MLATLPLLLCLSVAAASAGEARARPRHDDAARAERGLLPRKARRPERTAKGRRLLVAPPATWLGEPDALPDAPALARSGERPEEPPPRPARIAGAVSGVEVEVTVVLAWGSDGR